ncbi:STY0301 family protein [Nitrospirillum sp. BR 11828]|uniref:STY0301 family protein n=1 Tax=Nitrospirillum sp. BR 11828 TaxID=3104325 RepID=UPI002ACA8C6F|nr:STY0301 family protein [Nitrospirillum sp. BR 11828]MDZ5646676.1 STY0301 family protein [Nitrospirillum sp. BR 11828]
MASLLLNSNLWISASLILMLCGACEQVAFAAPREICPARSGDLVKNIYIFNGKPEEEVFLAPDDDRAGQSTYTVSDIYQDGRFVTVRCKYVSGFSVDVELKEKISKCLFSEKTPAGEMLRCQ